MLTDLLGSAGVIAAALIMIYTGWNTADPLISACIVSLVMYSSWKLVKESVHILMEGVPGHIEPEEIKTALKNIEGVIDVHELHIWTVTQGFESLSAHLLVKDPQRTVSVLKQANCLLAEKFGLRHCTLQVETELIENSSCDNNCSCG